MTRPIFLSIVMPAYNEAPQIQEVIQEHVDTIARLSNSLDDWELVCLDDASQDGTAAIVEQFSRHNNKIRLLRHAQNKGIYQSFTDLYLAARGTHIYVTGSDGQWPAGNLLKMIPLLESGADLIVGVRQNRHAVYSLPRRFVSYAFNFLAKMLFGISTRDAGSIKLGVRDVFTLNLISRSPFVEAERIIRAHKSGYRVEFVPITFLARSSGKARGASLRNILSSLRDCVRLFGQQIMERGVRASLSTGIQG